MGLMTGPCDRRTFLAAAGSAAAGAACGSGGAGDPGPTAPTSQPPVYASVTDDVGELLTGRPIASGRILFSDRPPIEIRDGRYTLDASHRLEIGSTHRRVRIEASGCVTRMTGVVVEAAGLRVDLGYRRAPLDLVGDPALYERWLATRYVPNLMRWDPGLYRGAFVYDRQLFRYLSGKPVLFSTDYDVEPSFVASASRIAATEIAAMTGGALRDGVRLASETPQSAWPLPPPDGWLVFYTIVGYFEWQSVEILTAVYPDVFGTVSGASVSLPPSRSTTTDEMRAKTREGVGVYRNNSIPPQPPSLGEAFGTIQYSRKIGHHVGDVSDYQD
jgi:hypothetical protein